MSEERPPGDTARDLSAGIPLADLPDGGTLLGKLGDESLVLVRRGDRVFAVGATCTHYGGPLSEGLVVEDTVRCPWHHAAFRLDTGEAVRPPALNPVPCWRVRQEGGRILIGDKVDVPPPPSPSRDAPDSIVIVGGGPAGLLAAETARRDGYSGRITIVGAEKTPPVDRPNLSKDYLAGKAPEEWIPLRPPEFLAEHEIELAAGVAAASLDVPGRRLALADGRSLRFGALLLATGASPVRLTLPGGDLPQVHYLRTLDDSRAIIASAERARAAVVIGASFIGLEAAASLRQRGLEVHVVAPDARPLEKILGPEVGDFVRTLHEAQGVVFHLERSAAAIDRRAVTLSDGASIPADLVVVGVGVRPNADLAERAGIAVDRGVLVDDRLETSAPGIFAAGDVARTPDPRTGNPLRVEHWVFAERQGRTAGHNLAGRRERFAAVPFFWSQHYDVSFNYVGHADRWDAIDVDGSLEKKDCAIRYSLAGRTLAVATLFRDRESLEAELRMEREIASA